MLSWVRRALELGLFGVVLVALLGAPGAQPETLDYRIYQAAERRAFNPAGYMVEALAGRAAEAWLPLGTAQAAMAPADEVATVKRYLAGPRRADPALRDEAERILQRQIAESLADLNVEWPVFGEERVFPPVQFEFTALPDVLIVSRRDRIERITGQTLKGDTSDAEAAAIEAQADSNGVSSLVVKIGGLGVYPSMIPPVNSLEWLVPTLAHEWAHQFFALHPIGWRYALDLERDPNMVALNESAAEMIGDEVGWHALERFYGLQRPDPATANAASTTTGQASDFSRRLRASRERVDALLAAGQVDEAERFMEEVRQGLVADGYRIRKLNQAYFAFYGAYAAGGQGAGGADPVGEAVRLLRRRSASIADFVNTMAWLTGPEDLFRTLNLPLP